MGGIAGIVYPDLFQVTQLLTPMLQTLAYRGPNVRDEHTYRNTQVGCCGQKLNSNRSTVVAGLDGAFTNRKELLDELKSAGHRFDAETDADILAAAYAHWGESFAEHLQGEFALFIFDQSQEKIILARDRIGKKPLYWYTDHRQFIFASELKALLATGAVPQAAAVDALSAYLYFGYIPQDMTPIKGVNKLLPGYLLQYKRDHSISIEGYWSYSRCFQETLSHNKDRIIHNVDQMLANAVAQNVPEQSPFGCFVSGGLGSAAVAYYLRKQAPKEQIQAFTVEFQGENPQDTQAAKEVAQALHLQHECGIITPQNVLNDFVKTVWYLDEPLGDPNVIATSRLAAMAQPVHTVFSGMGSDELMAGHSRYTIAERTTSPFDRMVQGAMPLLKQLLLPVLSRMSKQSAFKILQLSRTNPWHLDYLHQNALFSNAVRSAASPMLGKLFDPIVFLHKFHNLPKIPSTVASFLYFDVKTRLVDCYMQQYERLTAAHGLAWKTPFLTQPLIEYLAALSGPDQLLESEAFFILKEILKDTVPDKFINRPKKTRKHFLASWATQPVFTKLFNMLPHGTLVESGLISSDWLKAQLRTPETQKAAFNYLWSIFSLEVWFHIFINRPVQSQPPQLSIQDLLTEM